MMCTPRLPRLCAWTLGLVLLASAVVADRLHRGLPTPNRAVAGIDLDAMIPAEFAGWRLSPAGAVLQIQPQLKPKVEKAYASTLGRTYVNRQGQRIMLSIAYGDNQASDRVQAHRPEFCYKAQGFELSAARNDAVSISGSVLPLRRLFASRPGRSESISYWMTIDNQAILPGLDRKLAQLRHGLAGEVPDGLLVRVSSIDRDAEAAYGLHDRFIRDLLTAVANPERFGLDRASRKGHTVIARSVLPQRSGERSR